MPKTQELKSNKLEDYNPGATKKEVMTSLKKILDFSKKSDKEGKENNDDNKK